jgi:hypothetical protein
MNVIRHDYEGLEFIVLESLGVVEDGFHDHVGKSWLAEVERAGAGLVQKAVHSDESFAGG